MTQTPAPAAGRSPIRDRALRLAVFISPHGFGHAARTCAVLEALHEMLRAVGSSLEATIFTTVPRWFFEESLDFPFAYRELACDVGMVQKSAVEEDLPSTVEHLEKFWTEAKEAKGFHRRELQQQVRDARADAVLCDIAPLGLVAARDAGLPSVLIESFTWDWIYDPLVAQEPRFATWVDRMRELFALADLRIQAEPVCEPLGETAGQAPESPAGRSFPSMKVSSVSSSSSLGFRHSASVIRVPPIARRPRSSVAEVRARLGLAPAESGRALILVSMGGIPWSFENLERCRAVKAYDFVVPGGAAEEERHGNLVLLPHHSPVHHPDLVAAADVVVGKLGYSTVAEAVAAGTRFLFAPRPGFREHPVLARFVANRLPSRELAFDELVSGSWIARLPALLELPRAAAAPALGAVAAARAIAGALDVAGG